MAATIAKTFVFTVLTLYVSVIKAEIDCGGERIFCATDNTYVLCFDDALRHTTVTVTDRSSFCAPGTFCSSDENYCDYATSVDCAGKDFLCPTINKYLLCAVQFDGTFQTTSTEIKYCPTGTYCDRNYGRFECDSPVIPITLNSTSDTTPTAVNATSTTTIDENDELPTRECYDLHSNISISPQTHEMQLSSRSGEIFVKLETSRSDMMLIWFGAEIVSNHWPMYRQGEIVHCLTGLSSATVAVTNLQEGLTYTFCLMSTAGTTVSPLNCLSYHRSDIQNEFPPIWVYESSKWLIVSGMTASLVLSIVAGFFIGIFSLRKGKNIPFDFGLLFGYPKTTSIMKDRDGNETDGSATQTTKMNFEVCGECATGPGHKIDRPLPPQPKWKSTSVEHERTDYNEYENECENYYSVVK